MTDGLAGNLCPACLYARRVVSGTGSEFVLCRKAAEDRRFAKYPRQPMPACPGFVSCEAVTPRDDSHAGEE